MVKIKRWCGNFMLTSDGYGPAAGEEERPEKNGKVKLPEPIDRMNTWRKKDNFEDGIPSTRTAGRNTYTCEHCTIYTRPAYSLLACSWRPRK